jgi:hypothetical protein
LLRSGVFGTEGYERMDSAEYVATRRLMIRTRHSAGVTFSRVGLICWAAVLLLDFLVGCNLSRFMVAQNQTEATYVKINRGHGFALQYPSRYELKNGGDWGFHLIENGKIVVEGVVEDDTFKIFVNGWKQGGDTFTAFARERVTVICAADGPDGSSYCDLVESEREGRTKGGLRYLEYFLMMTREDFSTNRQETSRVGPVYIVDISRPAHPLALMIFPGHGTLASKETAEVMSRIVETVRVGA